MVFFHVHVSSQSASAAMRFLHDSFPFLIIAALFSIIYMILFKTGLAYAARKRWRSIGDYFHAYQFFKVPEFDEDVQENFLYRKVHIYLNFLASNEDSDSTNLVAAKTSNEIIFCYDHHQVIDDNFLGARLCWFHDESHPNRFRTFILKIRRADKRRILRPYVQHIHKFCEEFELGRKDQKLYINVNTHGEDRILQWKSVPFKHPCKFETMTMDSNLKNKLKADLEMFLKSKQYYRRLGRVWKRSYLLCGPPGTGKSSCVAAMANLLEYDVYDIDLSRVMDDSDLKLLLLRTTHKSVIVIEDLDKVLRDKSAAVTLSGILNFMDGVLNSYGAEERIMVFTMNDKEHVDPSLLRPGRIDVCVDFPMSDFSVMKTLANFYLGVKDHRLFSRLEEIFQNGATLSPAEIGELMLVNRNSPNRALRSVMTALQADADGRLPIGRRKLDCAASKMHLQYGNDSSYAFSTDNDHAMDNFSKRCRFWSFRKVRTCS